MWHLSGTRVTNPGFYRSSCRCSVEIAFGVGAPFAACPSCRDSVGWSFHRPHGEAPSFEDVESAPTTRVSA